MRLFRLESYVNVRWTTWLPLLLAMTFASAAARADRDDDDDAKYEATVSGDFEGTGKVSLSDATVTFTVRVKTKSGVQGDLQVVNLPLKNNRFAGEGTVLGKRIRIAGRVEKANFKGDDKARRLLATFGTATGETGRIVAYKKKKTSSDDDDDHDDD
jgi:hypothetical protein